ncbi:MAG: hypothetical protein JO011_13580 [Ktedonobacteraceae bacterium]|nr:hypothetical protein [Ktedonobacteraceae bacterium]MBV9711930.1 hypothetical protein [Ktedonobacteraceae bacterium]
MQQLASRPRPDQQANNGGAPRSQVILIVALLLFSVAGLASGFSVGALTRPQQTKQMSTQPTLPIQPQHKQPVTPQVTKTVDILAIGIGCPNITTSSYAETADNTTTYTIQAQVMDKSIENKTACGQGKPLQAPGVTCRIWLTKDQESLQNLRDSSTQRLMDVATLQAPFPHEKTNILLLDGTPQVQECNSKGETTWKYHLASNTDPGIYFIAVLTDWKGQGWNWKWVSINITKAH